MTVVWHQLEDEKVEETGPLGFELPVVRKPLHDVVMNENRVYLSLSESKDLVTGELLGLGRRRRLYPAQGKPVVDTLFTLQMGTSIGTSRNQFSQSRV